jgi:predicted MFS family arabinose efflux permease
MIAVLSFIQFTVILDFMVLSPLGALLLPQLQITTAQFGLVVSAYAFSAGITGLLAAGFADRFDRKRFLLFFYAGFIIGTVLCGIATTYRFLLFARIITGVFGGVIGSVGFAIMTDLFRIEVRGRVMGFMQMSFAASQILGLPIGLFLANRFGWHAPFWMIAILGFLVGLLIMYKMEPVTEHLTVQKRVNAFQHLKATITKRFYQRAFISTVLLATGGFMLMPFGSAYSTNNLGIKMDQLPLVYLVTGVCSIVAGPLIGKLTDQIGRFKVFLMGTVLAIALVGLYTNLNGPIHLWVLIVINVILFVGITARMISASTLISTIPAPHDRGAFMSINSSIQQISGGVASFIAGLIVIQTSDGKLSRYPLLGLVVILSMLIALSLIYWLDNYLKQHSQEPELNQHTLIKKNI